MRRRFHDQLMLDLVPRDKRVLPGPAPEELLQALADLLLEALGNQNKAIPMRREACDASEDHA